MNKIIALTAFAAALVCNAAAAAPTTELKVTGVIKPPACVPAFSGGGVVDYGVIPAASLPRQRNMVLPEKEITLSISCDAPMRLAIATTDNRAASKLPNMSSFAPGWAQEDNMFGLGRAPNGVPVGAFLLAARQHESTADGRDTPVLYSSSLGWREAAAYMTVTSATLHGWGTSRTIGSYRQIAAKFTIVGVLNKPENLPLQQEIPIDGSVTFELRYL